MAYEIELTSEARRHLNRLPEKVSGVAIALMLGALSGNPQRAGKPLVGELEGMRSARRGDFRVIYEIEEDTRTVVVLRVQHRGDVYRPQIRRPRLISTTHRPRREAAVVGAVVAVKARSESGRPSGSGDGISDHLPYGRSAAVDPLDTTGRSLDGGQHRGVDEGVSRNTSYSATIRSLYSRGCRRLLGRSDRDPPTTSTSTSTFERIVITLSSSLAHVPNYVRTGLN